jgi:hypothetical protein
MRRRAQGNCNENIVNFVGRDPMLGATLAAASPRSPPAPPAAQQQHRPSRRPSHSIQPRPAAMPLGAWCYFQILDPAAVLSTGESAGFAERQMTRAYIKYATRFLAFCLFVFSLAPKRPDLLFLLLPLIFRPSVFPLFRILELRAHPPSPSPTTHSDLACF